MQAQHRKVKTDTNAPVEQRSFEENFKEKYQGREFSYQKEKIEEGFWIRFKKWLENLIRRLFHIQNEKTVSKVTDILMNIAMGVVFLLALYFIIKAVLMEDPMKLLLKKDRNLVEIKENGVFIKETDYQKKIQQAINKKQYRKAVRYLYLMVLQALSNKKEIVWNEDKTNEEYYHEIKDGNLKQSFLYLSYIYDYIWYGDFTINRDEFEKANRLFQQFYQQII